MNIDVVTKIISDNCKKEAKFCYDCRSYTARIISARKIKFDGDVVFKTECEKCGKKSLFAMDIVLRKEEETIEKERKTVETFKGRHFYCHICNKMTARITKARLHESGNYLSTLTCTECGNWINGWIMVK